MARRLALFVALVLAFALGAKAKGGSGVYTVETVPNVHIADASQYVTDPSGFMSAAARDTVNGMFARLEATTGIEVAVVLLPSVGEASPFDFAQDLFRKWGVGKADNDNGLLVLYVADAKKIRFHTGYGLEGLLTDAMCRRIQERLMVPAFARGDVDGGMVAGMSAVCSLLDGSMEPQRDGDGGLGLLPVLAFVAILVIVLIMTGTIGGRKRRCAACGVGHLKLVSTDYFRSRDGRRFRKDVYVCSHCGRVTVENTPTDDDGQGPSSGLGAFLGGMMLGSMLRGGHGGGGGPVGGSFGGGDSGGGGAESSW